METPDELIESKAADILVKDGQEWIMRPTAAALMQLCQKCHNNYDRKHRNQTIRNNKLKGQLKLQL